MFEWTPGLIAARLGLPLRGSRDIRIAGAAALGDAGPDDIAFVGGAKYFEAAARSQAGCLIAPEDFTAPDGRAVITAPQPRAAFAQTLSLLYPDPPARPGIHPAAIVDPTAQVHAEAEIGPFVHIGANTRIGARTRIAGGATIGED